MARHYFTLVFMLLWMISPLVCYAMAPRKGRDPFFWVAGSTLLGPVVALVFVGLPARRAS